jgi:uracil phosphoribosyltransferase
MLATGGSIVNAVKVLIDKGVEKSRIKLLSILAAPEGIENVSGNFPEVEIYSCVLDSHLNEKWYIVPGL